MDVSPPVVLLLSSVAAGWPKLDSRDWDCARNLDASERDGVRWRARPDEMMPLRQPETTYIPKTSYGFLPRDVAPCWEEKRRYPGSTFVCRRRLLYVCMYRGVPRFRYRYRCALRCSRWSLDRNARKDNVGGGNCSVENKRSEVTQIPGEGDARDRCRE